VGVAYPRTLDEITISEKVYRVDKIIEVIDLKYTCPCCGYMTLSDPPGHFDICPICYWEDDNIQRDDPDYWGGANDLSLRDAQKNFAAFGAKDKRYIDVVRKPMEDEVFDPTWKPLAPK
jgi:hypothetical protein